MSWGAVPTDYAWLARQTSDEELRRLLGTLPGRAIEQRAAIVAELLRRGLWPWPRP